MSRYSMITGAYTGHDAGFLHQGAAGNVEELKAGLCKHGALEAVACLALNHLSLLPSRPDPG